MSTRPDARAYILAEAKKRILTLDGAWGSMIQTYALTDADYRGARFAGWPRDVKGNNDLLILTRPDIVSAITEGYLKAGADIARELGDTDIILMRKEPAVTDVRDAKRVGFVFPCYGGGLPGGVEESLRKIQVGLTAYTFGVCQYAGYMGSGLYKLNSIIPLRYWTAVSHQCTCIWLLPHSVMLPPVTPAMAQRRADKKAKQIAQDVLAWAVSPKAPPKKPVNQLESSVWPKIVAGKAQKFAVSDACVACGQCARLCPRGNIRIEGGRAVIGGNCIQCLSCLQYCPQQAISIGRITDRREHYHNPNVTAAELTESVIHVD